MPWVFLVFFSLVVLFSLVTARYKNPYKLYYIIGLKGSGKTTYMVSLMRKFLKKKRIVYTNIDHVKLPGIRFFDTKDLASFQPEPNSILFVDEAGLVWDNRDFKNFDKGLTQFWALQRQYRCTVYINSQSLDVDKKIRDRIDNLFVMTNIANCIGVIRRVRTKIVAYEGTSQAEGKIGIDYKICGISGLKLLWLPRYRKYFSSFAPPLRPSLPYTDNPRD